MWFPKVPRYHFHVGPVERPCSNTIHRRMPPGGGSAVTTLGKARADVLSAVNRYSEQN